MFYRPEEGHGLPHNPFNAIITPRPIAWISSRGSMGDNLAPYSFFNAVAYVPPQLMFASTGTKDSLTNIRETGVFAVNIIGADFLQQMSASSAMVPRGEDEFALTDTARGECTTIPCPLVIGAPATLECRVSEIVPLKGKDNHMVIAEITGIHLLDSCVVDGRFSPEAYRPLARMGYRDYTVVEQVFEHLRPSDK